MIHIPRFRPNIVIRGAGVPFVEDMIREFVVSPNGDFTNSGVPINLVSKCTRCLVSRPKQNPLERMYYIPTISQLPNVDLATGVRDKAVPYKVLMKFRRGKDPVKPNKACFGCNGVPMGSGIIRVGDFVHVREWAGLDEVD